jgi:ubiquitin related modifier 1
LELIIKEKSKKITLELPDTGNYTLKSIVEHITTNYVAERPELFAQEGTVRPGILVLVNETDWELLGGIDAPLSAGDEIVFISTLHGG